MKKVFNSTIWIVSILLFGTAAKCVDHAVVIRDSKQAYALHKEK